jgi:hypothetical protein
MTNHPNRKRPSLREAVSWIAWNDDVEWLEGAEGDSPSVTAHLVADLFGVPVAEVAKALRREVKQLRSRADRLDEQNARDAARRERVAP